MTTSASPISKIKKQAEKVAAMLKAAERGEPIPIAFAEKLAEARGRAVLKTAIIMDDKIITLDLPWATIRDYGEVALTEYIVKLMRNEASQ